MKTFSAKPADVKHEWLVIDATDKVLGRVASEAALQLRGERRRPETVDACSPNGISEGTRPTRPTSCPVWASSTAYSPYGGW